MKKSLSRPLALLLALLLSAGLLAGCNSGAQPAWPQGAAANDILTFENNAANKPLIRIGMQYYTPNNNFVETLKAEFPENLFVLDYRAAAGTVQETSLMHMLKTEAPLDMIVSGRTYFLHSDVEYFSDLSAESFLNNYLLASLNNVSVDGKLYFLPGVTTMAGIAYNTEMFAEHGWQVPSNTEEFFALCDEIMAAGIAPFSNCCKYANQVSRLFGTMCYNQLYTSDEDIIWRQKLQQNQATYRGHMEPFYELAKRFANAGIIVIDDFTASLTQQRQAFWNREYAMMFADTSIYTYAEAEGATFEIGFMPFPAADSAHSGFSVTPSYYIAIPRTVERDPERLALMKEILAFLSTAKGQNAMLSGSYNISNVKGVDISENPIFEYIRTAYENGNLYPHIEYNATDIAIAALQQASIKTLFEGGSVEDAITMMDDSLRQAFTEGVPPKEFEVVATAQSDFTTLETSYYLADKLREAAGAEIGLMINRGYFRCNLATIDAGDITADMDRFVMKGVGGKDWLTTYRLTGAQLKELLEHPIVNGAEIDALIAASGLNIVYAPWNQRGSRVLSLTREDGTELADDQLYTVAAWEGVIAEPYITETVQVHDTLGPITEIMLNALKRDGTIRPDIADRLTLVWPEISD